MKTFDSLHILPFILWSTLNKETTFTFPKWIPDIQTEKVKQLWILLMIPLLFTIREDTLPHVCVIVSYIALTKILKLVLSSPEQKDKDVDIFNTLVLATTLVAIYSQVWSKLSIFYALFFSVITILMKKSSPPLVLNDLILTSMIFYYTK